MMQNLDPILMPIFILSILRCNQKTICCIFYFWITY